MKVPIINGNKDSVNECKDDMFFLFCEWTPSIGRKVCIPRGILPQVQTGLTNWNPDNCLGKGGIRPVDAV